MLSSDDIAKMIDHSLLKPQLTREDIVKGCEIASKYNTISVCVRPCDIELACKLLKDTDVKVTTVIGFPHGANETDVKIYEAKKAIHRGAEELDMVLNIGKLLSREYDYVLNEIKEIVDVAHRKKALVKVILENCYLTPELIEKASIIVEKAGADFVKTSTGFGTSGANLEDLTIMRRSVSPRMEVKAAGGVRTLDAALEVRKVGATRFGATATVAIMGEAIKREKEGTLRELE